MLELKNIILKIPPDTCNGDLIIEPHINFTSGFYGWPFLWGFHGDAPIIDEMD